MGYLHLLFTYDKVKNSMKEKSHTHSSNDPKITKLDVNYQGQSLERNMIQNSVAYTDV